MRDERPSLWWCWMRFTIEEHGGSPSLKISSEFSQELSLTGETHEFGHRQHHQTKDFSIPTAGSTPSTLFIGVLSLSLRSEPTW